MAPTVFDPPPLHPLLPSSMTELRIPSPPSSVPTILAASLSLTANLPPHTFLSFPRPSPLPPLGLYYLTMLPSLRTTRARFVAGDPRGPGNVHLVGSAVNCWRAPQLAHVQTMMFALDTIGLEQVTPKDYGGQALVEPLDSDIVVCSCFQRFDF